MTELSLWKNQEINKLRREMERLFKRFYTNFGVPASLVGSAEAFRMELSETKNTLTVQAELPGVKPDAIKLSVTEDALTISADSISEIVEENASFRRVEQSSRSFSRTLALPCRIKTDAVKASYKENVLTVIMPKSEPQKARGVQIDVT